MRRISSPKLFAPTLSESFSEIATVNAHLNGTHFGITSFKGATRMQTHTIIEDLVTRELKSLCGSCIHNDECVYYKTSTKAIIQCELFELDQEHIADFNSRLGLCTTCDQADRCTLPGRRHGVWRCTEFS